MHEEIRPGPKRKNHTGKRFGKWTVLHEKRRDKSNNLYLECICDCGSLREVLYGSMRYGRSLSCGECDRKSSLERFVEKVNKTEACWIWKGSKHKGYGRLVWYKENGERYLAKPHRIAYELWKGPIPEGMLVCHICDNPSCVNPEHLFIGTNADNAHDRDRKGRQISHPGEKCGTSKLTEKDVKDIREKFPLLKSVKLAKIYHVNTATILRIVNRESWAHI